MNTSPESTLPPRVTDRCRATQNTKNQANMTPLKETNKVLVTDPKEIKFYDFPDKDLKQSPKETRM